VGHKFSGSRMRFGVKCGAELNNRKDFTATGTESTERHIKSDIKPSIKCALIKKSDYITSKLE